MLNESRSNSSGFFYFGGPADQTGPGGFQEMVSFPYERRSGRDRRSGGDRRQVDRRQPRDGEERDEYEEDLEKAAEMTAHLGEVWHGKGKDLFDRHKYEDAKKALNKAVEIRPDLADAWFLLACIESLKGEKSAALSLLAEAVEREPSYREKAKAHSAFKKYRGDGDFEKAIR
jgi:tetratricopeptide (TPR) repeat protein